MASLRARGLHTPRGAARHRKAAGRRSALGSRQHAPFADAPRHGEPRLDRLAHERRRAPLGVLRARRQGPAFGASFLFGATQLALNADYYLKAHWFHGKLTFALAAIALHHVIGAKSKRAASGEVQGGRSGAILTAAFLVSAFLTVLFAIEKTQLVR
jgi:hypothetical protein